VAVAGLRLRSQSGRARSALLAAATLLVSTALSLAVAELALDAWLDHQRRLAKAHLDYDATYGRELGPGGLGVPGFAGAVRDGLGGTVAWRNESHGFRNERDAAPAPAPGVLRILSLGDSFAAGYRVGQEDTYSRRLEEWASRTFGPTEVLIANVESPPRALAWLERFGWEWRPDLVLLGVTLGNDVAAAWVARHPDRPTPAQVDAMELPTSAWALRPRSALRTWLTERRLVQVLRGRREAIGTSVNEAETPRLFDGINGLGIFLRDPPPEIEAAYERLFSVLADLDAACAQHGVPCVIAVFPQRFQIDPDDWALAVDHYGLRAEAFDLAAPNRRIAAFCAERAMTCIDATDAMHRMHEANGAPLYLPRGDMHWNAVGHAAWLEAAKPALDAPIRGARARRGLD